MEEKEIDIRPSFSVLSTLLSDADNKGVPSHAALIKTKPGSVKRPVMTYVEPSLGSKNHEHGFYKGEYSIIDIGRAEDTDSYVFQAVLKKLALAMKEGWNLVGQNPETLKYVKRRFAQLEVAQDQTVRAFIIELAALLFRYHNAYILKARDIDKSGGKVRRVDGKPLKPVAGYFVASPDTIETKIGKRHNVTAYKHVMPNGRWKIFSPEDVIHIHVNRRPHFLTATPPWHPVVEDVSALRRIEEHVENLVYQHIYPLFQYKVGTETSPAKRFEDGDTEIDRVKASLKNMPSDGMIVTPERHELVALGAESRGVRAEPYLEYFKKRVIVGTGMSELDFGFGDTANRATADSMSKLAVANVKFIQQCLADAINFYIIRELLLESTFSFDVLSEENMVEMQFVEIDHEAQIKLQNHYMLLFQGNVISRTEARKLSGWEALTEDQEDDCHLCLVDMPKIEKEGEIQLENTKASAAARAAQSKQQPSNQHGKNSGPSKAKSSVERDGVAAETFHQLKVDLRRIPEYQISIDYVRQLFFMAETQVKRQFRSVIEQAAFAGAQGFTLTADLLEEIRGVAMRVFRDFERDVERLFRDTRNRTAVELAAGEKDVLTIERLEYRMRFIERTLTHKAKTLAQVAALRASDINLVQVKSVPGGEDYPIWNNQVIDLNSVTPEDLPPFHPNCRCELVPLGE